MEADRHPDTDANGRADSVSDEPVVSCTFGPSSLVAPSAAAHV